MVELVRRTFVVDVPAATAWDHLARVEQWPSWAKHIKRATLDPPGSLTPASTGSFRLSGGMRSTFRMQVHEPPDHWVWVGRFASLTVHYDHQFEPVDNQHTRLT